MSGRVILLTGGTSGLGLETARRLAAEPGTRLLIGVRRPDGAQALRQAVPADRLHILQLDLASLHSVRAFCRAVRDTLGPRSIDAMAFNGGIQVTSGKAMTEDGIEMDFQVNYLSHWLIHNLLKARLAPGAPVVMTTRGTHDPNDRIARLFGFRGGFFPSADAVAAGEVAPGATEAQHCLDRYATAKMCQVMFALGQARRDTSARFLAFDPGLMPGTGLARDRGAVERFGWSHVMPLLRFVMSGVSTPEKSARLYADLLLGRHDAASGQQVEFTGRITQPSTLAKDTAKQDVLQNISRALCDKAATAIIADEV
ncbi:MAG: SDR family NAD(P)-dependent oxidoreductase [Pseudomonadota bacterium]